LEPNKIGFTIFRFLYYFILILQVHNIIRKGKLIYFAGTEKSWRLPIGPAAQRRARLRAGGQPSRQPRRGARARQLRHKGKNVPGLSIYYVTVRRTIARETSFTDQPLKKKPSSQLAGPRYPLRTPVWLRPARRSSAGQPREEQAHE
jgi:hypothetical protein